MGAQIQARGGATIVGMSALFPVTISLGASYVARLSIDATGLLSASLAGAPLGTFMPGPPLLASGFVAVATQSAEASFDDVAVTQP